MLCFVSLLLHSAAIGAYNSDQGLLTQEAHPAGALRSDNLMLEQLAPQHSQTDLSDSKKAQLDKSWCKAI